MAYLEIYEEIISRWYIIPLLVVTLTIGNCYARTVSARHDSRARIMFQNSPTIGPKKNVKPDLTEIDIKSIAPHNGHWQMQPQIAYRPWQNGPYHVTMGLKTLTFSNWIEIDNTYLQKYQLKKKLYQNHRQEVLQVLPGCEEGIFESMHLLKDILVQRYPAMFRLRDRDVIENLVTGDVWNLDRDAETWKDHHPLEIMGLLATEDFFLLRTDPTSGTSTLNAATSCFPAGFRIEERVGKDLWGIHAGKVPKYESKLAKSMDRYFQKLRVDSPIQRFNYAIDDSDELFHRHSHHNLESGPEREHKVTLHELHLRVERQVLMRLPKTRDLLFSIRTYVTPITEVLEDRERAQALWTSVTSYTDDVARYKNRDLWLPILEAYLRDRWGADIFDCVQI